MQPKDYQPQPPFTPSHPEPTEQPLQQGRPVPAQTQNPTQQPQMVYVARPINPEHPPITPEAMARHEASKNKYRGLNLSEGEYVISAVRRHPIGLVPVFAFTGIALLALAAGVPYYEQIHDSSGGNLPATWVIGIIATLLGLLVLIGCYIAVYVYTNNKFYLTNESVIQEIQTSLFHRHEQTVSLANIEDASYRQEGFLPHIFNYGNIRLSTEGDETTYRFSYVANPKKEISQLNNAVEAFKNGRPVSED